MAVARERADASFRAGLQVSSSGCVWRRILRLRNGDCQGPFRARCYHPRGGPRVAELVPAPFPHLLRRMLREAEREQKVFDLPARRFWRGLGGPRHVGRGARPPRREPGRSRRRARTGQMAQNVLLSWLAGGRFLELKTVQVERPPDDPAAVHRHGDRRLQRGVEPGAAPRGEPARVREGLDADRRRAGRGAARAAGRPARDDTDPRPERGLRPRRDPLARGALLDRVDEGRAGRGRGPAARDPRRAPRASATSTSARRSPTR